MSVLEIIDRRSPDYRLRRLIARLGICLGLALPLPAAAADAPASGDNAPPAAQSLELPGAPQLPVTSSPADLLYYSEPEAVSQPSFMVTKPQLEALITIETHLDPFQLDATSARRVQLSEVIETALRNNLNIGLSQQDVVNNRWKLLNAYTGFLPDPRLGLTYDYVDGHIRLPAAFGQAGALAINSPFTIVQAGLNYKVFQGGKVLFTALQSKHNLRSSRFQFRATTNDALLEATRRYYNLLESEALLQIRIRAVATSEENLRLNTSLEKNGMATHLDVLQAKSQLADDRQNLIEQQVARRNASIQLSEYLNIDQSVDLQPIDTEVAPVRLISENVTPARLLTAAVEHRPELKSFKEQWLAAKNGIPIAASQLYPQVQLSATEYGIGASLANEHSTTLTPITLPSGGTSLAERSISKQITGLGVIGLTVNWTPKAFGLNDFTNIQAARAQARHALLQSNQEMNAVISQVRQSYLNQLSALRRSEESLERVNSSAEELRLSRLRMENGLGKNLDVLRAQQDLITALVQHVQSTIQFDIAQAQLLHDLGLISRDTVLCTAPLSL